MQGALSLLANTAQGEVDYNFGYNVPSSKQAEQFLQALQQEYIASGNGTLIIPGSGGQRLFYATNEEKNSPYINSGTVDKEIAGVIIKAPIKQPEILGVNNGKRDPATNLPLDDDGRYSQQIVVGGKTYTPKYFPCPTASAGCGGQNLDMSDPATAAYVKALDKKVFSDIGTAATIAGVLNPVGAIGTAAGATGIVASTGSMLVDDPFTALGKEIVTRGADKYLTKVLKLSGGTATRIIGLIDLAGGWDAFVNRAKREVQPEKSNNGGK